MSAEMRPQTSGLFLRIYLTFVLTMIAFAALSVLVLFIASARFDDAWEERVDEAYDELRPQLLAEFDDHEALERDLAAFGQRFHLRVALRGPRGRVLAGSRNLPRPPRHRGLRRLERGEMLVKRRNRFMPPLLHWGLRAAGEKRLRAVLTADAGSAEGPRWMLVGSLLGLLVILGLGALPLARSLVRRLAAVEDGAGKIADGALSHRLPLPPGGPRDEVDRLAAAFNQMAGRLEDLISGQQILLANVSHELRTPVARMRVLVEILEARTELLDEHASDETRPTIDRLHRGMGELTEDLLEIEALISDLLTSGKLELAADGGVEQSALVASEFLDRLGERFAAETSADPPDLVLYGDAMLLERLLSNLLSNARRACPKGKISLQAKAANEGVVLIVEDEGPGIPAGKREAIFEPFSRLDGARDRDRGGVGLGLYLCRQIVRAHGGSITTEERPDGTHGARFVITLPPSPKAPSITAPSITAESGAAATPK